MVNQKGGEKGLAERRPGREDRREDSERVFLGTILSQGGLACWFFANAYRTRQLRPGLLEHSRAAGQFPFVTSYPGERAVLWQA